MTDRRRNSSSCCSSLGLLIGSWRRDRDQEDARWASTCRAASSSSTRASPRRSSPGHAGVAGPRGGHHARARRPARRLRARDPALGRATRSRSGCRTSRTPRARRSRSARSRSCTSTTGSRTSSGPTASPTRPTRRSPTGPSAHGLYDAVKRAVAAPGDPATRTTPTRRRSTTCSPTRHALARPGPRTTAPTCCAEQPGRRQPPGSQILVGAARDRGRQGRPAGQLPQERPLRPLLRPQRQPGAARAPTSRTPSRTSTTARAAAASRSSRSRSPGTGARSSRRSPGASPTAAAGRSAARAARRPTTSSTSRPCSTTRSSRARSSTTREPGRDRRPQRRADLGRLHDPERAGPRATCSRPARCRSSSS